MAGAQMLAVDRFGFIVAAAPWGALGSNRAAPGPGHEGQRAVVSSRIRRRAPALVHGITAGRRAEFGCAIFGAGAGAEPAQHQPRFQVAGVYMPPAHHPPVECHALAVCMVDQLRLPQHIGRCSAQGLACQLGLRCQ